MSKPSRLVATLALMAFLGASAVAVPDDAQDARSAVLGFSTAWNRHDMVAFGKLFAPDADFVNVVGSRWKGREQIQMNTAWLHGTIPEGTQIAGQTAAVYGAFKDSTLRFTQIDVRFLRTDVAIAHVNWELLGDKLAQKPRHGLLIFVVTRQNSGWLIAAAQNIQINDEVP